MYTRGKKTKQYLRVLVLMKSKCFQDRHIPILQVQDMSTWSTPTISYLKKTLCTTSGKKHAA